VNQYLGRWLGYDPEFDEWRNIADLQNCIQLLEDFERTHQNSQQA
jgi:hypothetical protein